MTKFTIEVEYWDDQEVSAREVNSLLRRGFEAYNKQKRVKAFKSIGVLDISPLEAAIKNVIEIAAAELKQEIKNSL